MKRTHAALIALVLAVAVALGSFAAIRSTQLSTTATAAPRVDTATIARQNAALDRAEAALRAQLAKKPPKIAPIPAAPRVAAAPAQTVVYKRAPTIVHVIHRHGEHEGGESEGGGGDD